MSRARPNNARMTRQVPATATFEGRPDRQRFGTRLRQASRGDAHHTGKAQDPQQEKATWLTTP